MAGRLKVLSEEGGVIFLALEGSRGEFSSIRIEPALDTSGLLSDQEGPRTRIYVAGSPGQLVSRATAAATLDEITHFIRSRGLDRVSLITSNRRLRHEARMAGYTGPLRGELSGRATEISVNPRGSVFAPGADTLARATRLAELAGTLGLEARPHPRGRALSRLLERARNPTGERLELDFRGYEDTIVRVSVPDSDDLMPEPVAMIADTALQVLKRFKSYSGAIRMVSLDKSYRGMSGGRIAGVADERGDTAHISSWYVQAEYELDPSEPFAHWIPPAWTVLPEIPAFSLPDVTDLDGVTAHELWHLIWREFQARHFRDSMEIDIQLGSVIGAETLGKAVERRGRAGPAVNPVAFDQLKTQISEYATTNMDEAQAEIFKAWWTSPSSDSPLVKRFGELIAEHFPVDS